MKITKRVLVRAVLLALLLMISGALFTPRQEEVSGSSICSCGGRVFEDPANNPYPCGQCTWYVSYKRQDIPDNEDWGDAKFWNDVARAHVDPSFFVGTIPLPGAIAVWEEGVAGADTQAGHVAYVDGIQGDENNTFIVSEMNWDGRCFNEYRVERAQPGISFIYPPSDRPVPLWPYNERRIPHEDPVVLKWYGASDFYGLWYNIYYDDGGHDGGVVADIQEGQYPLRLPHPGVVTWLIWGYDASGGNEVQADLQVFYAGPCPEEGTLRESAVAETGDYCSGEYNPTPVPTSTPFPTIVPTPTDTPVPLNTSTIEPHTPTMVSTWTPGPTDTPPSTPTVTEHTATVVPTWTPGPAGTPLSTPTPSGGIATPTTSGVTVTPVACITVADVMLISSHWRVRRGDANYEERFDLNHDGIVNIIDIQLVSAHWGESCGD